MTDGRHNQSAWEREYQDPKFLSLGDEPNADVRVFMRWLRRDQKIDVTDWSVLDLGCGTGKNLNFTVKHFCKSGVGYDFSKTAVGIARKQGTGLAVSYDIRSIGEKLPLEKHGGDLVLDVTSSNSLSEKERNTYLSESHRVLKPGGYFFVRALCLDGDKNAVELIRSHPGKEPCTYKLPGVGVTERVFTESDIRDLYSANFEILHLEKTTGYQRWGSQKYKRNYWLLYLMKK